MSTDIEDPQSTAHNDFIGNDEITIPSVNSERTNHVSAFEFTLLYIK